jgi:CubicO group peptidase (beta-lactamase class C family)
MRARFARWRLNWEPGSRFEYHPSSSMWVIAALVEERTGVPFGEFVRTRVAEPLGLPDLLMGAPSDRHPRIAELVYTGTALTPEDFRARGWPVPPETEVTEEAVLRFNTAEVREVGVPGGGAVTGAAELALFYQALLAAGDAGSPWKAETLADARRVRTGDLVDPMFGKRAHRGLGITIAGDADRVYRGFGHTNSEAAFGHNGAGGQIAWADPATGLSFAYLTNGFDRDVIRQGRRSVALSSRAAGLVAA